MKIRLLVLFSCLFLLIACSTEVQSADETKTNTTVELASEVVNTERPLSASFMSRGQTFSYSFAYDGNLLKMMDYPLSDDSKDGPNFLMDDGTEITGATWMLSDLTWVPELSAVELHGKQQVYRYQYSDSGCEREKAAIMSESEGLVLQLKVCPGQDFTKAEKAFESLLDGLSMKLL